MITYSEALHLIEHHPLAISTMEIDTESALNRVIAKDIKAPMDLPPFDNAAVDGVAVKAADVIVGHLLPIEATIRAAHLKSVPIIHRGAAKIMTGAPMPKGADAIVMKENCTFNQDGVIVNSKVSAKDNVRFCGEDIKKGGLVCTMGTTVSPQLIGVLCGLGIRKVQVLGTPKIRIISTGDELVYTKEPINCGQVYYLVGPMLKAQCQLLHCYDVKFCIVGDNEDAIIAAIHEAYDADLVLLTGGMSKGDYDFVRTALKKCQVRELFFEGNWRPGKPLFFGETAHAKFFGIPGNPVAAFVCFHVFVRPLLEKRGIKKIATLEEEFSKKPGITLFARAKVQDNGRLSVLPLQGSHQIFNLYLANALAFLPPEKGIVKAGELIHYLPI